MRIWKFENGATIQLDVGERVYKSNSRGLGYHYLIKLEYISETYTKAKSSEHLKHSKDKL